MFGKECEGCRLREETIADLREQLREAHKTALAVIDAKAYVLRHGAEMAAQRQERKSDAAPPTAPGEIRGKRFRPDMTSEEIEASFAAEAAAAQSNARASGKPERDS